MRRRESGLALLSALLTVSLLLVIVIEMTDATLVHSHLSRNAGNAIAARLLARSAIVGGEGFLIEALSGNGTLRIFDILSFPLPPTPAGPGTITVQVTDEGGKLDLNQLHLEDRQNLARELFTVLDIDPGLIERVIAWTAEDEAVRSRAVRQDCTLQTACVTAPGLLRSVEDLRLIQGFTPPIIQRLTPYVTAFGERVSRPPRINVNTAAGLLLEAAGCSVGTDFGPPPRNLESMNDVTQCEDADYVSLLEVRDRGAYYSISATGTVGDTTRGVYAVVHANRSTIRRLVWIERAVFGLGGGALL